ncbi:methyltransferase domain-containing protein [Phytohabitans aurantiacus]|uniref:Methyltransferase n=1 Tax=Phytohabitans aurantiacus TaxID=3016789 RepID=A0ABQ5RB02_9ACTN|nr:methyltransferase domain-containing protein [Phytohabitans aurantiacus]GLI03170.1 methyltransferase [Phytohabitans aurantiacus]
MELTHPRLSGPRTAVVWAALRRELDRHSGSAADEGTAQEPLSILDAGGGTGGFAVPLAEAGHRVTVVDASPDALAALTRRAAEAGVADRVRALQGDADALAGFVEPASVDLVLCHSVLDVVDDPAGVVAAVAAALRPGGAASILVAGKAAAVLHRAITGQLAAAAELLAHPEGRVAERDTVRRRYDADSAAALLRAAGLDVVEIHGVRVIADLLPAAVADAHAHAVVELELAAAAHPPYRDIAAQLHLFARRP